MGISSCIPDKDQILVLDPDLSLFYKSFLVAGSSRTSSRCSTRNPEFCPRPFAAAVPCVEGLHLTVLGTQLTVQNSVPPKGLSPTICYTFLWHPPLPVPHITYPASLLHCPCHGLIYPVRLLVHHLSLPAWVSCLRVGLPPVCTTLCPRAKNSACPWETLNKGMPKGANKIRVTGSLCP